jgi:hypothetical protein
LAVWIETLVAINDELMKKLYVKKNIIKKCYRHDEKKERVCPGGQLKH